MVLPTAVLAWVLATMSILVAAPALAQEEAPPQAPAPGAAMSAPDGEPPPDIPDFAFNKGGFVVIDGDIGTSCLDFAQTEERITRSDDRERLARSVLEQCEQAGFLPSGGTEFGEASTGREDYRQSHQLTPFVQLPATGGPGLLLPGVLLAGEVLLIGLAMLGHAALRRAP